MRGDVRYGRKALRCPAAIIVSVLIVSAGRYDTEARAILLADACELWLSVLVAAVAAKRRA